MSAKTDITLSINGREHPIAVEPRRTLADAIREDCGQTGTHIGCEHGICGACTVIVDGEPVQAPHTPCSQPIWVPVCPQSSRMASANVLRGSTPIA